jgi:hypothetical protein
MTQAIINWARELDKIIIYDQCIDINNNIYVCGSTGVNNLQNGYFAVFDENGVAIKSLELTSSVGSFASSIRTDITNNIYICGTFSRDIKIGDKELKSTDEYNGFIARINSSNVCEWAVKTIDSESNIILTENSLYTLTSNNSISNHTLSGELNYIITVNDVGIQMFKLVNDNLYIVGDLNGIDMSGSIIMKYNITNSMEIWRSVFNASVSSDIQSLTLDEYENVYTVINFTGTMIVDGNTYFSEGGNGLFYKCDKNGTVLNATLINKDLSNGSILFNISIELDKMNNIYMVGIVYGSIIFVDIPKDENRRTSTGFPGYLAKFNNSFTKCEWITDFFPILLGDVKFPLTITPQNKVIISLTFFETLYIQKYTFPTQNIASCLVQYDQVPVEPICVPANTPIKTDQGYIMIQNINTKVHTIRGQQIIAITKSINPEKKLVRFNKHSLAINCPNNTTIMTNHHLVSYKGKFIKAKEFVGKAQGVDLIDYNGEILYNVLLKTHSTMEVNNMILETLHPENKVAHPHF